MSPTVSNNWQRLSGLVMGFGVALVLILILILGVSYIVEATDQYSRARYVPYCFLVLQALLSFSLGTAWRRSVPPPARSRRRQSWTTGGS